MNQWEGDNMTENSLSHLASAEPQKTGEPLKPIGAWSGPVLSQLLEFKAKKRKNDPKALRGVSSPDSSSPIRLY